MVDTDNEGSFGKGVPVLHAIEVHDDKRITTIIEIHTHVIKTGVGENPSVRFAHSVEGGMILSGVIIHVTGNKETPVSATHFHFQKNTVEGDHTLSNEERTTI